MTTPTDADGQKAHELARLYTELSIRGEAEQAIRTALAEAREEERERTLQGATIAQIQTGRDRRLGQQEARHGVEMREALSQIAELEREREKDVLALGCYKRALQEVARERDQAERNLHILRQEMSDLGDRLLQPAETPEAVAIRHLKGVDHDPVLVRR